MADTSDLLIAEYNAHQARYRQLTEQAVWLQNYALIYAAVIWTWAAAVKDPFISNLALWLPVLVTILFFLKVLFLHSVANNIFQRLAELEGFLEASERGWYVRMFKKEEGGQEVPKPLGFFWGWTVYYWSLLLLVSIALSFLGTVYVPHISTSG